MKVLAVLPLYPPSSRVGAWLATHSHLVRLVERGHEVRVVRYLSRGEPYNLDGIAVHPAGELHANEADVVICHLGDNGRAAAAAITNCKPLVRMVHSAVGVHLKAKLESCNLAVHNSQATMKAIGWDGPQIVAHPPLRPQDHLTTPGSKVTLVNLSEEKGSRHLHRYAAKCPEVRFLGVKGGHGKQVTRNRPNIEYREVVTDMRDVWSDTRVLLMPSKHEAWGMTAVEAMVSGIPVVAHPTDGLRESLGEAGIFADREDIKRWADHIHRLHDPDEWAAASERATLRACELAEADPSAVFAEAVEALV